MMQQTPKTSEYSNECREQVIRAMKVKQESSASKPTQTPRIVIEVRAPSSTPRLPQKDSSYFHYHKVITITPEYPTPQSQVQVLSW